MESQVVLLFSIPHMLNSDIIAVNDVPNNPKPTTGKPSKCWLTTTIIAASVYLVKQKNTMQFYQSDGYVFQTVRTKPIQESSGAALARVSHMVLFKPPMLLPVTKMFRHFSPKVLPLQKKVLKRLCKPICQSQDKIGGSKTFGKTFVACLAPIALSSYFTAIWQNFW